MVRLVSATAIGGFFTEALVKSREPHGGLLGTGKRRQTRPETTLRLPNIPVAGSRVQ